MSEFERTPPQDVHAEMCALGGMMLSKDAVLDVCEILKLGDFYRPAHALIFAAIGELHGRGEPIDAVTVAGELARTGQLGRMGGAPYLHDCVAAVPTAANAGHYARIVRDRAVLRRIVEAGTRIAQMGYAGDGDVADIVDAATAELYAAVATHAREDVLTPAQLNAMTVDELELLGRGGSTLAGAPTGYVGLDELTGGLRAGQMIVLAGRPGLGKSTAAMDAARACCAAGIPSLVFSLEMSGTEIWQRALSAEGTVSLHAMRNGILDDRQWDAIMAAVGRTAEWPLLIDANPRQTITSISTTARRVAARTGGLGLIVVDYLQLVTGEGRQSAENRRSQVDAISRGLKLLAKELNVPVIAVCQLNRGPEQRADKRPVAADLRESGQLEQDADLVILVHREDAYDKESPRAGEVDLIVAKHRNGPTATVTVAAQLHYSRFVGIAQG